MSAAKAEEKMKSNDMNSLISLEDLCVRWISCLVPGNVKGGAEEKRDDDDDDDEDVMKAELLDAEFHVCEKNPVQWKRRRRRLREDEEKGNNQIFGKVELFQSLLTSSSPRLVSLSCGPAFRFNDAMHVSYTQKRLSLR